MGSGGPAGGSRPVPLLNLTGSAAIWRLSFGAYQEACLKRMVTQAFAHTHKTYTHTLSDHASWPEANEPWGLD